MKKHRYTRYANLSLVIVLSAIFLFFNVMVASAEDLNGDELNTKTEEPSKSDNDKPLVNLVKFIDQSSESAQTAMVKTFKVYTKQTRINGYLLMTQWIVGGILCFTMIILLIILSYSCEPKSAKIVCWLAAGVVLIIFLLVSSLNLNSWLPLVLNPEYAAIQNMVRDASFIINK